MSKFVGLPDFMVKGDAQGNEIQSVHREITNYGVELVYTYGNGHQVALPIPKEMIPWLKKVFEDVHD